MSKIIQIMPVPEGMMAIFKKEDGQLFVQPLVAIGIDDEGDLHALDMDNDGWVEKSVEASNFYSFHIPTPTEPMWVTSHNLDVIRKKSDARIAKAKEEEDS
jgi:hypothetical protein